MPSTSFITRSVTTTSNVSCLDLPGPFRARGGHGAVVADLAPGSLPSPGPALGRCRRSARGWRRRWAATRSQREGRWQTCADDTESLERVDWGMPPRHSPVSTAATITGGRGRCVLPSNRAGCGNSSVNLRAATHLALDVDPAAVRLDHLRAVGSPKPEPPSLVEKKASNMWSAVCSSMPRPVSIRSRATPLRVCRVTHRQLAALRHGFQRVSSPDSTRDAAWIVSRSSRMPGRSESR